MAQNEEDLDLDVESPKKPSGAKVNKIVLFSVIGVLVIALSVTTTLLIVRSSAPAASMEPAAESPKSADKAHEKKAATEGSSVHKMPHYLNLDPPFVVNLNDDSGVRFLQVAVSVMSYKQENLEQVSQNMPLLRHNLVLLFSSQKFADIKTTEGKEKLQAKALEVIRKALTDMTGKPLVDAVYLPSIVGQ